MLAMDRDDIVKTLFEGRQPVSNSWLPPAHYGYLTDAPKVTRDLTAAGKLLDDAGWKLDGSAESVRKNDKGEPLVLTLMTTAGNKMRADVMQMLQAQLADAGIKLKLEVQQAQTFFGETTQKRKFQLAMYAWIFGPLSDGSSFWTSEAVPSEANGWQGQNYCGLLDDEITRLDRSIPLTLAESDRAKLFQAEQRRWLALLPAIPLYFRTDVTTTHKDMLNWRPTGTLTPISWNSHEWAYKAMTPVAE
jgi:peptide/nickel transport system substrate-binding protein